MDPKKAIEILEDLLHETPQFPPDDRRAAVILGIEALTFLVRWRDKAEIKPYPLLPSETTD